MHNVSDCSVSIEKFAAYLDGNLTAGEMQQMSSFINSDSSLQEIVGSSNMVDEALSEFSMNGIELPQELMTDDFSVPNISELSRGMDSLASIELYNPRFCTLCAEEDVNHVFDESYNNFEMPNDIIDQDNTYFSNHNDTTDDIYPSIDDN